MTPARTPQTRPAVAIRQATRILGTDEDGVARLVKSGTLTEMYTRPTSGSPEAIYNVTELEALAAVERVRAELEQSKRGGKELGKTIDKVAEIMRDTVLNGVKNPRQALILMADWLVEADGMTPEEHRQAVTALENAEVPA